MKEIQIEDGIFISDLYCAYLSDISTVVISDLHLGFEEEMNLHGLFLPRLQLSHVQETVGKILDRYQPQHLIINGDFKHEFSRNLPQEWDDIIEFIDKFSNQVDMKFIRGNHDNYLISVLKKRDLELLETFETERYHIFHGDKDLPLEKFTILGHEHPSLVLRDRVGGIFKIPAFVYNKEQKVLITPAMSFFSSGSDVIENLVNDEHFTPSIRHTKPEKYRVYGITEEFGLVDFGYLGDLKDNQRMEIPRIHRE